jgi:hypothetical protein
MSLVVGGTSYTLAFPLAAVIDAEEKLGRSLKTPADWFNAPAKDVPVLLRAGLAKHHPSISEHEVAAITDELTPEAVIEITNALGTLAFPRFVEKFEENLRFAREKAAQTSTTTTA